MPGAMAAGQVNPIRGDLAEIDPLGRSDRRVRRSAIESVGFDSNRHFVAIEVRRPSRPFAYGRMTWRCSAMFPSAGAPANGVASGDSSAPGGLSTSVTL